LFDYIRNNIFPNPRIVSLVDITAQLVSAMNSGGVTEVSDSTKKNLRRNWKRNLENLSHFLHLTIVHTSCQTV
jgi:hypothetical protein